MQQIGSGRKSSWANIKCHPRICLEGLKKITKTFSQNSRWSGLVTDASQKSSYFRRLAQCHRVEFQPRSDAQCSFHVSLKWACAQDYVSRPRHFHIPVGLIVCYWHFCGFLVSCMAVTRCRSVDQCCQLNYKFQATQPAYFKIILPHFPLHISLIYFAPRPYTIQE